MKGAVVKSPQNKSTRWEMGRGWWMTTVGPSDTVGEAGLAADKTTSLKNRFPNRGLQGPLGP